MYKTQPKKRKYTPKKKLGGITQKYAAKPKTREIKTLDITIPDNYPTGGNYLSDTLSGFVFNTKPQCIQNVVQVEQGAGISQRIGNRIALKSLRVRMSLEVTDQTGTYPQGARFMVVYDRQPNGVYPAVNQVLANITTANTTTNGNWLSSINPNNFDRYIVLCDKLFIIGNNVNGPVGTWQTDKQAFIIDEFIKLKGLETQFKSSTAGSPIADLTTGALYIIGFGDQTEGNEAFYMSGQLRLRYYDN